MKIARFSATCLCLLFLAPALSGGPASVQQEKVFFGNLHSHTSFSDGSGLPREAYLRARDIAKVDFLALTEHNHAEALGSDSVGIGKTPSLYNGPRPNSLIAVANSMTTNGRFVALYGQEYSTISSGNHTNIFDIGQVINVEKGRFDKLLDFLAVNKDSTGRPAVIMFNHPKNTLEIQPKEYGRDDFPSLEQDGGPPDPAPDPDPSQAVASKTSNTFHISSACLDAQRIKPENLVTGTAARQGRQLHLGCPRTTGGR